jgi:hypothetical protein
MRGVHFVCVILKIWLGLDLAESCCPIPPRRRTVSAMFEPADLLSACESASLKASHQFWVPPPSEARKSQVEGNPDGPGVSLVPVWRTSNDPRTGMPSP